MSSSIALKSCGGAQTRRRKRALIVGRVRDAMRSFYLSDAATAFRPHNVRDSEERSTPKSSQVSSARATTAPWSRPVPPASLLDSPPDTPAIFDSSLPRGQCAPFPNHSVPDSRCRYYANSSAGFRARFVCATPRESSQQTTHSGAPRSHSLRCASRAARRIASI